jgi:hypothetical protein
VISIAACCMGVVTAASLSSHAEAPLLLGKSLTEK